MGGGGGAGREIAVEKFAVGLDGGLLVFEFLEAGAGAQIGLDDGLAVGAIEDVDALVVGDGLGEFLLGFHAGGDAQKRLGLEPAGGGAVGENGVVVADGLAVAADAVEGFGAQEGGLEDELNLGGVVEHRVGIGEGDGVVLGIDGLLGEERLGFGDLAAVGIFLEQEFEEIGRASCRERV